MSKDYSSIYNLKNFALTEVVPKYFDVEQVNDLNIGLLGYTTELITNVTEDSFNTVTTYINEMFPNLAVLPESIYSYGALFQIDGTFATASELNVLLLVAEDDIIRNASLVSSSSDSVYEFFLDSNMTIDVEGVQFMPDYDIRISYKILNPKTSNRDYIFTAQYDMRRHGAPFTNQISSIINPYIKIKRIMYQGVKYLLLMVTSHRINRFSMTEMILSNDVISTPTYTIEFDNSLASFDVFYREGNSVKPVQLEKRLSGTSPLKTPFCYYKMKGENSLEITFTQRDTYFQPKTNSEIIIDYSVTDGSDGNFPLYDGSDVTVVPSSETYTYNNGLVIFAIPRSSSSGGRDRLSLENLKNIVVEKFSTVESYTNENDLQMYFANFQTDLGINILFIKKRDDIFERLFTSYSIFKQSNGDTYPTNTLNMSLDKLSAEDDGVFDTKLDQSNSYILKPGHTFRYKEGSTNTVVHENVTINHTINSNNWIYNETSGEYYYELDGIIDGAISIVLDTVNASYAQQQAYNEANISVDSVNNRLIASGNIENINIPTHITNSTKLKLFDNKYSDLITRDYPVDFLYTNPYLMYVSSNPLAVGYYLNTTSKTYILDYKEVNPESIIHFICNSLTVKRNAIIGEDTYKLRVQITPTTTMNTPPVIQTSNDDGTTTNTETGSLKLKLAITKAGSDICYTYMTLDLENSDIANDIYTYTCEIQTDDKIGTNNEFAITDMIDSKTGEFGGEHSIPMTDCIIKIYAEYSDIKNINTTLNYNSWQHDEETDVYYYNLDNIAYSVSNITVGTGATDIQRNAYSAANIILDSMSNRLVASGNIENINIPVTVTGFKYVRTNTFTTELNPVTFIYPVHMIRSSINYLRDGTVVKNDDNSYTSTGNTYINISSVPLVRASTMMDEQTSLDLFNLMNSEYDYMINALNKMINNYSVDMKFYNTYGKSKNFYVGDNADTNLDKVNIGIKIMVRPIFGIIEEDFVRNLKYYIKEYIEKINDNGTNSLYISNLIQSLENDFPDLSYMKFVGINNYDSTYQVIDNLTVDLNALTKEARIDYVPEYLTISLDDIQIEII